MRSNILKIAVFTTGVSGIVAEYILSTLASYFIGDSVTQWALIISIMLFSMGLGSRISKNFRKNLLSVFIYTEFLLSILICYATLTAYISAGYTQYYGLIMYTLSIIIGALIGLEIPLVIRINKDYQSLRTNISSVMEKDYYGSLIGGLFFTFVGLPYLGLTYTPIILGSLNFIVAMLLFFILRNDIEKKQQRKLSFAAFWVVALIFTGLFYTEPIILRGEQRNYKDKIIYSEQSKYQKIIITKWNDNYWLFINNNEQLSTLDEALYHEPLVHPAMSLLVNPKRVLILGGGDGCAARELLKYESIEEIHLVDLDPAMTRLGQENEILVKLNNNSMNDPRVKIYNQDAFNFMVDNTLFYDLIIADLPDPKSIELGRLYSYEFYTMCYKNLLPNGVLITQAGSPYYTPKAFECINQTIKASGFNTVRLHNQVLTLGEWGWVIGSKALADSTMKLVMRENNYDELDTKWLNKEAVVMMQSFGKDFYRKDDDSIKVNKVHDPVLPSYYRSGAWDVY